MKNIFRKTKLPRHLKRAVRPDKAFAEKAKARFFAAFDARHGENAYVSRVAPIWSAAFGMAVIVLGMFGVSVYASTKNVPADSPLYGLKRLNENVVLAFASPSAKPALQAEFTSRRADELNDLEERNPSSTVIGAVATDLGQGIAVSAEEADDESLQDGRLTDFCANIANVIATDSSAVQAALLGNEDAIARLQEKCAKAEDGKGDNGGNSGPGNGLNATSTIETHGDHGDHGDRGDRHGRRDGFPLPTSFVPPAPAASDTISTTTSSGSRDGEENNGDNNKNKSDRHDGGGGASDELVVPPLPTTTIATTTTSTVTTTTSLISGGLTIGTGTSGGGTSGGAGSGGTGTSGGGTSGSTSGGGTSGGGGSGGGGSDDH